MHRYSKPRVGQVSNQKFIIEFLRRKSISPLLLIGQMASILGSNHLSALQFRNNDKCVKNVAKKQPKRALWYVDKPHFTCVTKNRFEPLSPTEKFCTDNDTDLMEEPHCSPSKQESDSTNTDSVFSNGRLLTLNPGTRPNHDSIQGENVSKTFPHATIMEDKYDLALQVKNRNNEKLKNARSEPTHQKWNSQNKDKFVFIPLGPLTVPDTDKQIEEGSDPIKLYDITRNQKTFNFLSSQICVHSQLNPEVWRELLSDYWDQQLPYLIKYGFPLDFNRNSKLTETHTNHKSAVAFPKDVEAYIEEEQKFVAIHGPFDHPPFDNFHTSPFMTRDKPGAPHRRVIIDLSFPQGEAVNSNIDKNQYLGTDFVLPSIDLITSKVRKLGKGSLLYKIDISRAFRSVKIDPRDYFLLGLKHENYYLDTCLRFGYRHGSRIFQRLSDAIRFIMTSQGHDVINYIDDVIGFGTASTANTSFGALQALLQKLGFDISINKLVRPATKVTCLGVEVNSEEFTVAVPEEKLSNILEMRQN